MLKLKIYFLLTALACFLQACSKSDVVMPESQLYTLKIPANFPLPPTFPDNKLTKSGVELGKQLFFDARLSGNNKISCATCHLPSLAFSDGVALGSAGFSGATLHRHAPALINLAWANNGLFWDGGSTNLESQAFAPITAHDEMNQNLFQLIEELKADPSYVQLFRDAFGEEISSANIAKALAQFQRTLISGNSRYDKFIRKENNIQLSDAEKRGLSLLKDNCVVCHSGELFTDHLYHNNGLDDDFSNTALEGIFLGRYRVSYNPFDLGAYRTPTLRNIMITAPYMHDGRFKTIEEVLNHYSSGVKKSSSLASQLLNVDGSTGFSLSESDKNDIKAFLHTLTDSSFLSGF